MIDIEVTQNSEFMVAGAEGITDPGIEFVDRYNATEIIVVDAGYIIVHQNDAQALCTQARTEGLTVHFQDTTGQV